MSIYPWDSGSGLGGGLEDFLVGKGEVLASYTPKEEDRVTAVHEARLDCANTILGEKVMRAMYRPVCLTGSCIIERTLFISYC